MDSLKNTFLRKTVETEPLIQRSFEREEYIQSFPKVLVYKGYELPGDLISAKLLDKLHDFEVRESDVFIVSYPESGSSILEEVVSQIVDKLKVRLPAKGCTSRRLPGKAQVMRIESDIRMLGRMKSPRLFSTNLPLELLPEDVRNGVCKVRGDFSSHNFQLIH